MVYRARLSGGDDRRAPREKQALYNYQRKSQVYRKDL
jgi:hypothetical protein